MYSLHTRILPTLKGIEVSLLQTCCPGFAALCSALLYQKSPVEVADELAIPE
jgi:hypothetical protein